MRNSCARHARQPCNYGVPISIHLAESPFELQYSKDTFGKTSIELLESIGFFEGPTIAAHVVWPTAVEIPILVERKVGVIHNPTSNMKIASGIAPVTEMLQPVFASASALTAPPAITISICGKRCASPRFCRKSIK